MRTFHPALGVIVCLLALSIPASAQWLNHRVPGVPRTPDGKVNLASMEEVMRWYVKMGYLSSPVDLARSVDPSFAEAAVTELGPYQ